MLSYLKFSKKSTFSRRFWGIVVSAFCLPFLVNFYIVATSSSAIYDAADKIPDAQVGLILGAAPYSEAVENRVAAAVELYKLSKVKHFIISGDNSRKTYNEPEAIKNLLISAGVPSGIITLDYAGFRTLDSVYRAKYVFGVDNLIIVTQKFHSSRAQYLAGSLDIKSTVFVAERTSAYEYNKFREYLYFIYNQKLLSDE